MHPTSALVAILDRYLADLQAGRAPDRAQLLADHPELAAPLRECLEGIDFLHRSARSDSETPETLGDFHIIREVGRGGMGVVYEAEQLSLKRRVALKVLRLGHRSEEAMERFRREAETVAELHHTNIVPIFSVGRDDDVHYYAMQFIEGRSLAEVAADGESRGTRVSATELAGWALQAADALDHAHRNRVVHRDVKPSNLILDHAGRIWLSDFGLAKRADDVTLSVAGALLGTPRYMSPEQASAMTGEIDFRTDLYSLGATLYELATGRPIFQATSPPAMLAQILNDEPVPPRTFAADLPRDLETIILKCLAKAPQQRYASARALTDDLRAFLDGRPIQARRPSWWERLCRWSRRNPLAATLTGALCLVLVSGLASVTALWAEAEQQRRNAETQAHAVAQERDTARARLWTSLYEQARAERLAGNRWKSLEVLMDATRLKKTPELQQEAIQAITSAGLRLVARLGPQDVIYGGDSRRVGFSFDSSLAAAPTRSVVNEAGTEVHGVRVWDVASGGAVGELACVDRPGAFAFSPTTHLMAVVAPDETVRVWNPLTDKILAQFPGTVPIRFDSSGRRLAVRGAEGVDIRSVPDGHLVRRLGAGLPVQFASDDVLLVRRDRQLDAWNIETGALARTSPETVTAVWTVPIGEIAGSGPLIALRNTAGTGLHAGPIAIWNALTDETSAVLDDVGRVPYAGALAISPAARLVAWPDAGQNFAVRMFDLRLGRERRPLFAPNGVHHPLMFGRFNASGAVLAAQEGGLKPGVRLWNVETGESLAYLHDHEHPVWSPNGRFLAVTGPGEFRVSDTITRSGSRAALKIYELAEPVSTARLSAQPQAVVFQELSEDALQVTINNQRFLVDARNSHRLRPLGAETKGPRDDSGRFVASGSCVWKFQTTPNVEPHEPARLHQVSPETREILLRDDRRDEPGGVHNIAVNPDGRLALVEWRRNIPLDARPRAHRIVHQLELWDLETHARRAVWEPRPERSFHWGMLRFSPDGQTAVTTETGHIAFRDAKTGAVRSRGSLSSLLEQTPQGTHTKLHLIIDGRFTRNGKRFVCGGESGRVGVFAVSSGQCTNSWDAHDGDVLAVAVSPDDHTLATGGTDGSVCLWDLSTGQKLAHWTPRHTEVTALGFSPDARSLVTGCGDGTVQLWDLDRIRAELTPLGLQW